MIRTRLIVATATIGLLLAACDSAVLTGVPGTNDSGTTDMTDTVDQTDTAVDLIATAEADGNFTTLLTALEAANLRATLADVNNTNTVFAPTDSAFAALGEETFNALLADSEGLTDTLLYHVLAGSNDEASITEQAGTQISMLNDKSAVISIAADQLRINTATVITSDIIASNGIIHVIDAVLTPPAPTPEVTENIAQLLGNDPQFSSLVTAITDAGLGETLSMDGSATLFAPTNDAFSAWGSESYYATLATPDLLNDILLNHVVQGSAFDSVAATALAGGTVTSASNHSLNVAVDNGQLMINNATVVQSDIYASNGVIHAIDAVLIPQTESATGTILSVLSANPDYSKLVDLIEEAGETDRFNDLDAGFTVFAPNNAAFTEAETALAAGFNNDQAALGTLLLGHLHNKPLSAIELIMQDGSEIEMGFGAQQVSLSRDTLLIGGAEIVDPDMQAQNGVIHGISSVLFP